MRLKLMTHRLVLSVFLLLMANLPAIGAGSVGLGIDVLAAKNFNDLRGKRVGLLSHPAGVNRQGIPTWQVLWESRYVNLVALFGPEHGFDGRAAANEYVETAQHPPTGLPQHSLYGPTRKPTPAMLRALDVLVVDLQDIGTRSYTYVSAMRLAMEACFEQGIEVMVLDRPNPLGGLKVSGPMLEPQLESYVGPFPVPYVHGLTIGELAIMAKRIPGWLDLPDDTRQRGKLMVVPMSGWRRDMLWPDTGLEWIPTSPAIPTFASAVGYPMTGLGTQLGRFSHGFGTSLVFRFLSYPGKRSSEIAGALNQPPIPGLMLQPAAFVDDRGKRHRGAYVRITDYGELPLTDLSFYMMRLAAQWAPQNPFAAASDAEALLFNKHVGSSAWFEELTTRGGNADVEAFLTQWREDNELFQEMSSTYWIYQP